MSKIKITFFLGIWVAILPYLGFPYSLRSILLSISGLGVIYLSYLMYNDLKKNSSEEKIFDNFSENKNFDEKEQ